MILTLKELREELDTLIQLGVDENADVFIELDSGNIFRIVQIDDENEERNPDRPSTTVILCAEYEEPLERLQDMTPAGTA